MPIEGFSVAFDDPMLDPSPTWTRLDGSSGLVASFQIRRGRQDELQKTGTGTATVTLNDVEGDFDPTHVGSPYTTSGIDGKQAGLALWNPVDEVWVTVFRGFVDSYSYELEPSGVVTRIQVELVDGLDYLAGVELHPGEDGHLVTPDGDIFYDSQEVDLRINKILTDAGWPSTLKTIFSGNVEVKQVVYPPGTTALSAIADAADAEWPGIANVYCNKAGEVTFHGRHARFDPDGVSAGASPGAWDFTRWPAGDGSITAVNATYAQIRRLSYSRSRQMIVNRATATPDRNPSRAVTLEGVTPVVTEEPLTGAEITGQIVENTFAQGLYGIHAWSAENLLTRRQLGVVESSSNNDLTETRKFSEYYVNNYAAPQTRVTGLGFRSISPDDFRGPATWALLTGVEISDIVKLKTEHPGGGGFGDEEFFVEGISYDVQPLNGAYADITLSLDVSPQAYYIDEPDGWS